MPSQPYGCRGCNCWADDSWAQTDEDIVWQPNARCPHHGLLADFVERKATGTYRVVANPKRTRVTDAGADADAVAGADARRLSPGQMLCRQCGAIKLSYDEGELKDWLKQHPCQTTEERNRPWRSSVSRLLRRMKRATPRRR